MLGGVLDERGIQAVRKRLALGIGLAGIAR